MEKSSTKIDISIIIVNYNSSFFLLQTLESIINNTCEISYEIIIVDNNSKDNTVKTVYSEFQSYIDKKTIKIIVNEKNLGFSKGVNQGIKLSTKNIILHG